VSLHAAGDTERARAASNVSKGTVASPPLTATPRAGSDPDMTLGESADRGTPRRRTRSVGIENGPTSICGALLRGAGSSSSCGIAGAAETDGSIDSDTPADFDALPLDDADLDSLGDGDALSDEDTDGVGNADTELDRDSRAESVGSKVGSLFMTREREGVGELEDESEIVCARAVDSRARRGAVPAARGAGKSAAAGVTTTAAMRKSYSASGSSEDGSVSAYAHSTARTARADVDDKAGTAPIADGARVCPPFAAASIASAALSIAPPSKDASHEMFSA
jgi:hypothetical protein